MTTATFRDPADLRSDARQRRAALVRAATDCFRESGYMVALEEVAERAGVGRGTLYRNFADRLALAVAVLQQEIEELEAIEASIPDTTEALAAMLERAARTWALFSRLSAGILSDSRHRQAFESIKPRAAAVWAPIVARAQAEGILRADLGPDSMMMAAGMIGGAIPFQLDEAEVRRRITVALDLLNAGLQPRCACD